MRLVGISVALGLAVGCASAAFAADTYAAIAFSKRDGTYGYGNKYGSRAEAEERALQECGPGCTIVMWVRNQCAGLAVGRGRGYGPIGGPMSASSATPRSANARATPVAASSR